MNKKSMTRLLRWLRERGWRPILLTFILASVILSFISILVFFLKFKNTGFSEDPQRWGEFGDYFAGTISTLLALINVCVTIWLTVIVNRISTRNTDRQIEADKRAAMIQLRHEALKEFRFDLDKSFKNWQGDIFNPKHVISCTDSIQHFYSNYDYLFDDRIITLCLNLIEFIVSSNGPIKEQDGDMLEEIINQAYGRKDNLYSAIGRLVIS
jgi:hypothetical protein